MLPEHLLGVIAGHEFKVTAISEAVQVVERHSLHASRLNVEVFKGQHVGVGMGYIILQHLQHLVIGDRRVERLVARLSDELPKSRRVARNAPVLHVDDVADELGGLFVGVLIGTRQLKGLPLKILTVLRDGIS